MSAIRLPAALRRAACLVPVLAALVQANVCFGQMGFGSQAVGGISVDADGIVRTLEPKALESLAAERTRALADAGWSGKASESRTVSLKAVASAVKESTAKGTPLPAEVQFLGGLQRIERVFVDPDGHDILLCGPADALAVDGSGAIVGATSRRPPLHLEDLVVCLRAIEAARAGGMTCSIDPTPEGIAKLQAVLRRQGTMGPDPKATFTAMEQALGPQKITVGGVPTDSRIARVLVAADYRMKRIGMGLEESGLKALPSYLAMIPAGGRAATLPRFWLEADYDPISRDPDELAWSIGGRRMKCLTESDVAAQGGMKRGAVPADALAKKWCDAMTASYDELAGKQPVFAELVNCIDLAVVAALIKGRQLDGRAGCDLSPLTDAAGLKLPSYDVPASVPTVATGVKKGTTWVLSASGGVKFQPWQFAANTAEAAELAASRTVAIAARPATLSGCSWE
ncbi:MAG: DUF1598 domain-containing protein [Planctomycetota bacterium]|nr:MAG: DUF1598 domain-containing protein [Planctomycetota bacterium]